MTEHEADERMARLTSRRHAFQTKRSRELRSLLDEREDLRGVHELADMMGERLSWCA